MKLGQVWVVLPRVDRRRARTGALRAAATGGSVAVVEHPFPAGSMLLPYLHTREDEYSIVTEGQVGFRSGDHEVVLGAGG